MTIPITDFKHELLQRAYGNALKKYGGQANVSGIDIGYRNGTAGELAVRIQVVGPEEDFRAAMRRSAKRPDQVDELTDEENAYLQEIAVAYFEHTATATPATGSPLIAPTRAPTPDGATRDGRAAVIQPGIEVAHRRRAGGTLGLIVVDRRDNVRYMLSAAHVLRAPGANAQNNILQPTFRNGGRDDDSTIGEFVPHKAAEGVDAALARLTADDRLLSDVQFGTKVVVASVKPATLGDKVQKSGVGTGITNGIVDGIGRYYLSPTDTVGVEGFRIVPDGETDISDFGDSGAVWYTRPKNDAVPSSQAGLGIHVAGAGSNFATRPAIACHLEQVLDILQPEKTRLEPLTMGPIGSVG